MSEIKPLEFVNTNIRLSGKYNFIIFPITGRELETILETLEYKIPKNPEMIPNMPQFEIDGLLGTKENLFVDLQKDRQVLGMNSNNTELVISEFDKFENAISKATGQEMSNNVQFYETILNIIVKTGKNPMEIMEKIGKKFPFSNVISKIIGAEVAPLGMRYSPAGLPVYSKNWFEIRIEPLASRSTTEYFVRIIYRHESRTNVMDKVKHLMEDIEKMLHEIESVN